MHFGALFCLFTRGSFALNPRLCPYPVVLLHAKMGILGLSKLIADAAPSSVKENEIKNYFGEWLTAVCLQTSSWMINTRMTASSIGLIYVFVLHRR